MCDIQGVLKKIAVCSLCLTPVLSLLTVSAVAQDNEEWPITVEGKVIQAPGEGSDLKISLVMTVDEDYHVYSSPDQFFALEFSNVSGLDTPKVAMPEIHRIVDPAAFEEGMMTDVFGNRSVFNISGSASGNEGDPWRLTVSLTYQACSTMCLPPKTEVFTFSGTLGGAETAVDGENSETAETAGGTDEWLPMIKEFTETARTSGIQGVKPFLKFLNQGLTGEPQGKSLHEFLMDAPVLIAILAILGLGFLLNFTPCVLPMIPVNLAIIGAGSQAGSKTRGFLLGATYGGAIALVYGILGLLVSFTSASFGSLSANPWFNLAIALVFLVLALAMLGVFNIDLSSLGNKLDFKNMQRGSFSLAAFMGGIAALLAGACVAPIVVAVLLLTAERYSQGNTLALGYPFLLGLGLGLPWPFAGAGLSFLPKPGKWMSYVKYAFGILILVLAVYYGKQGVKQLLPRSPAIQQEDGWHTDLTTALMEAKETGKPLFIDFWATWCKNCHAMDKTTLKDEEVLAKLDQFVLLKFQAENPGAPGVKPVWDYFNLKGLPSYIVLHPPGAPAGKKPSD